MEYTDIQKYMIGKIEEAIKVEEEKLAKAPFEQKTKIRIRIGELKKQLENAKKPVVRTEKEKELINKMVDQVEKNIEQEEGKEIEGRGKELTSKEELDYTFAQYVQAINNQKKNITKNLETVRLVGAILEEHIVENDLTPDEKASVVEDLKAKKQMQNQLNLSMRTFDDRLEMSDEVQKWALDNYEMLSKLNKYLGNPLRLKDYEEYMEGLKKEYEVE